VLLGIVVLLVLKGTEVLTTIHLQTVPKQFLNLTLVECARIILWVLLFADGLNDLNIRRVWYVLYNRRRMTLTQEETGLRIVKEIQRIPNLILPIELLHNDLYVVPIRLLLRHFQVC
jgi:hypothetical protein